MVLCRRDEAGRHDWMSPRVANQRVEDAAFNRAEQALRQVEVQGAAARKFEFEQLELLAGFLKVEAKEHQQRVVLTAMHQKKQRAADRHRLRNDEAKYHERTESSRALPLEPKLAVLTARQAAQQAQHDTLIVQIAAAQQARQRGGRHAEEIAALAAREAEAVVNTAPGSARQAEQQSVHGQWSEQSERALARRKEVAAEWERQQELALRRRGVPSDQSCRAPHRPLAPPPEWAAIV